jgi:hypothetical protein
MSTVVSVRSILPDNLDRLFVSTDCLHHCRDEGGSVTARECTDHQAIISFFGLVEHVTLRHIRVSIEFKRHCFALVIDFDEWRAH